MIIQDVFEMLHVELVKNIKKLLCQKIYFLSYNFF
jgi:hypothetical protein